MRVLPGIYAVARINGNKTWAEAVLRADTVPALTARIITPWDDTLICLDELVPVSHDQTQRGFRALAVEGTLDFALTGVISRITGALAREEISVFVVSTYDTDCVLVRQDKLDEATAALRAEGIAII